MEFGLDIVDISRIQRLINTYGSKFLSKIYTLKEINEAKSKGHFAQSLSGKFAAKEAYIKTCSPDDIPFISFLDIEILSDKNGKPFCFFQGSKKENLILSISHEQSYAVAGVIRFHS